MNFRSRFQAGRAMVVALAAFLPILPTQIVHAQDEYSRVELFGGLSLLRPNLPGDLVDGEDGQITEQIGEFVLGNVAGWGGSGTFNLTRSFGITADFSGHYRRLNIDTREIDVDVEASLHTFLFGPTLTMRRERVNTLRMPYSVWDV